MRYQSTGVHLDSMAKRHKSNTSENDENGTFPMQIDFICAILRILATIPVIENIQLWTERNSVLNMTALVCCSFRNLLAPSYCACIPALTRWVNLNALLLPEGKIPQQMKSLWQWVRCLDLDAIRIGNTLASLAAGCQALTCLGLMGCGKITDKGLASLAAGCKALTSLSMSGCNKITGAGLASLAAGCKALITLTILFCALITTQSLKDLEDTGTKINWVQ